MYNRFLGNIKVDFKVYNSSVREWLVEPSSAESP